MSKIKAISLGGYESRIPDDLKDKIDFTHYEEAPARISPEICPDAAFIVVITKFSKRGSGVARAISSSRPGDIPVLLALSWNYVIHEILACDRLKGIHSILDGEEVSTSELAIVQEPQKQTDSGVSEKVLWEAYELMLSASVTKVFLPGEKMDITEFLPLVAEDVGISEADVMRLLPYLAVTGVIDNPVGTTWRLLGSEGYTVDLEPARKPAEEPESQTKKMLGLITGLGPGPYPSRYAIESAMMAHKEFTTRDGSIIRRNRAYQIVKKAEEIGSVFRENDAYYIVPDDSVKLTPIDHAPPAQAPKKVVATDMLVEDLRELKVSDDVKFLRSIVGRVEMPKFNWQILAGIKSLIPTAHWDKFADVTVMRVLRKKSVSPRSIPKPMFSPEEWDALAWEAVREFKIETLAPYFNVSYYDEELQCVECRETFMFTKGEKKFYFEKELTEPRRCPACRKSKGKVATV